LKRVVPGLICHQETAKTLIFEDISLRPRYNLRRSLTFQTPSQTPSPIYEVSDVMLLLPGRNVLGQVLRVMKRLGQQILV
jgi:hypothetical protein